LVECRSHEAFFFRKEKNLQKRNYFCKKLKTAGGWGFKKPFFLKKETFAKEKLLLQWL